LVIEYWVLVINWSLVIGDWLLSFCVKYFLNCPMIYVTNEMD